MTSKPNQDLSKRPHVIRNKGKIYITVHPHQSIVQLEVALSELTADHVFHLHPKIRWAAYSTEQGRVLFSTMRPGVRSHTPDADDRAFMELGIMLMCEMGDRLSSSGTAGKLESIIVNFTHDSVMIVDHAKRYLAFSADRADALRVFEEISPQLSQLPI